MTTRRTPARRAPSARARTAKQAPGKKPRAAAPSAAVSVFKPRSRRTLWVMGGTVAVVAALAVVHANGVLAQDSFLTSFLVATPASSSSSRHSTSQQLPRRVLRWLPLWQSRSSSSLSTVQDRRNARLRKLEAGGKAIHALPPAPTPPLPPPVNPYRQMGVYLAASSVADQDYLTSTFDELARTGGTAFVFDVKGTQVYYYSTAPYAQSIGIVKPLYELPEILRQAKERGLYTIARYIAIKDQLFTDLAPETQLRHKDKGYPVQLGWVDPSNATAQLYNSELLCELAANPDLDEINLDYIRLSSYKPYSTGYSADDKAALLMSFIKMSRDTIDRCGPKTKLGVSTFAILGWRFEENRETIGQDVVQYAPYVDVISPMAYQDTFTAPGYYAPGKNPVSRPYWLVYRTLIGYRALLGPEQEHKLRPWLQAYSVSTKDVTDAMNAVVDAGFCGFTFWNASNSYGPVYAALGAWQQPERCRSDILSVAEPKLGMLL